jgi:hypothetical protein
VRERAAHDVAALLLAGPTRRDGAEAHCGDRCDQSGEQNLPVIDKIDDGCVVRRHGDVILHRPA